MLQWELLYAALGMGSTCGTTVLGAAMVFFKGRCPAPCSGVLAPVDGAFLMLLR